MNSNAPSVVNKINARRLLHPPPPPLDAFSMLSYNSAKCSTALSQRGAPRPRFPTIPVSRSHCQHYTSAFSPRPPAATIIRPLKSHSSQLRLRTPEFPRSSPGRESATYEGNADSLVTTLRDWRRVTGGDSGSSSDNSTSGGGRYAYPPCTVLYTSL